MWLKRQRYDDGVGRWRETHLNIDAALWCYLPLTPSNLTSLNRTFKPDLYHLQIPTTIGITTDEPYHSEVGTRVQRACIVDSPVIGVVLGAGLYVLAGRFAVCSWRLIAMIASCTQR